jgi:hypothetical protein
MIDHAAVLRSITDGFHEVGEFSYADARRVEAAADAFDKLMNPEKPDNCPVCNKTTLVIEHGKGCWHIGCSDAYMMTPEGSERCQLRPSHMGCVSREAGVDSWNKWAKSYRGE